MSERAHITSMLAIIAFVTAVASADQEEPFSSCRSLKGWNALLKSACNTICTSLRTM